MFVIVYKFVFNCVPTFVNRDSSFAFSIGRPWPLVSLGTLAGHDMRTYQLVPLFPIFLRNNLLLMELCELWHVFCICSSTWINICEFVFWQVWHLLSMVRTHSKFEFQTHSNCRMRRVSLLSHTLPCICWIQYPVCTEDGEFSSKQARKSSLSILLRQNFHIMLKSAWWRKFLKPISQSYSQEKGKRELHKGPAGFQGLIQSCKYCLQVFCPSLPG